MAKYLDKPSQWKKLVDYIYGEYAKRPVGWDTEFTNVDFDSGDNCVGKAELDVWSIALFTGEMHPRGYEKSVGYVLPRESLETLKPFLEDEQIVKPAHNATVDCHTLYNLGIDVLGVVDTLHLARFAFPGKFRYGIDALAKEHLDESKFTSFKELCSVPAFVTKQVKVKKCDCGEENCRKRKGHNKYIVIEDVDVERGTTTIPISYIGVGHPKWQLKLDYAAQDSVLALCEFDYACRRLKRLTYENPFR